MMHAPHRPGRLLPLCAAGLYTFLYAPLAVVVGASFNRAPHGQRWEGFTTAWYGGLSHNELALAAVRNTLLLGIGSAVVSTLLGTLLGYGLERHRFPGRTWLARLLHVPVFIPDVVMAAALLLFFGLLRELVGGVNFGLPTMTIAHVTFQIPFVAIVVRSRLAGLDPALDEAARDLGATRWQRFAHVTLPLMVPGVLAGALLAFTLSLDDFVVSFFTSGPGSTTLPILIYASTKRGISPELHALAALIVVASVLAAGSVVLLQRRRPARSVDRTRP